MGFGQGRQRPGGRRRAARARSATTRWTSISGGSARCSPTGAAWWPTATASTPGSAPRSNACSATARSRRSWRSGPARWRRSRSTGSGRATAGGGVDESALPRRVRDIVEAAADVRASDVVFEMGGGVCTVSAIVNDRRRPLGGRLTEAEGSQIANFLFHSKEKGSRPDLLSAGQLPGVLGARRRRGPPAPPGERAALPARPERAGRRPPGRPGCSTATSWSPERRCSRSASPRPTRRCSPSCAPRCRAGSSSAAAQATASRPRSPSISRSSRPEHDGALNMVTVEDPVEYDIPGAIQIAVPTTGVGEDRGEHFTRALMHFVRIHPGGRDGLRGQGRQRGPRGAPVHRHRPPSVDHDPRGRRQRHPVPHPRHGGGGGRGLPSRPDQAADEADPAFGAVPPLLPRRASGAPARLARRAPRRHAPGPVPQRRGLRGVRARRARSRRPRGMATAAGPRFARRSCRTPAISRMSASGTRRRRAPTGSA